MDQLSLWNWTKAALGLRHVRNALQPLVVKHVNKFYNDLQCRQSTRTCQCNQKTILASTRPTSRNGCPTCSKIYQRLSDEMIKGSPTIPNCKVEQWTNHEWEVAKAFIPLGGYIDIDSVDMTDVSGLISICLNANFIRRELFQHDLNAFEEVRKIRNKVFHSSTLEIKDTELKDNVRTMLGILDERLATNDDIKKGFQTARQELQELPNKPLCENCLEEIGCRKDALESLNIEAMQLLEQLEQQQSGADTLETQKQLAAIIAAQNIHSTRITCQEQKMDQTINTFSSLHIDQEKTVDIREQITDILSKQEGNIEPTLQESLKHIVKIYQPKPMSDNQSDKEDLRLLLVGRMGHGKSETGNSILGYKAFTSRLSAKPVTKTCACKAAENDGKRIEIVDTPGLMDTMVDEAVNKNELYRALIFSAPGFHAIALVIKPDRFSPEMKQVVDVFFDFFGDDVEKYAFVIFTHTDTQSELMDFLDLHDDDWEQPPDTDLSDCIIGDKFRAALRKNGYKMDESMKEMIDKCGSNVAIINNKGSEEQKQLQVDAIQNTINTIKLRTGHTYFTNAKFLSIDRIIDIENDKASRSKEKSIEHVPWAWLMSEKNNKDVLEKILQDATDKEKEAAENRERERMAFEEQQSAMANELEEQLRKERKDREKEQKEWEERQQEKIKQDHERMQAMMNEQERETQKQDFERKERELQQQLDDRRRWFGDREWLENEKREYEAGTRERERERHGFERWMLDFEKNRGEMEMQRIRDRIDRYDKEIKRIRENRERNDSSSCIVM